MKKIIAIGVAILVLGAVIIMNMNNFDYSKAYEKTQNLKSFEIGMSTIVTITEGDVTRQSVIDQTIKVKNRGTDNMIYSVSATSTSSDTSTTDIVEEVSQYTYYKDEYYIAMPGIKYKSYCGYDAAAENIDNLVNAISFPYEKMYNVTEEKVDGRMHYEYEVEYADVSTHVLSALQSAMANLQGVTFKLSDVWAEAVVEKNYVTKRNLWVVYDGDSGQQIVLEIATELKNKKAEVDIPDESKYAQL